VDGLVVEPQAFTLAGSKSANCSLDLSLKYTPPGDGLYEAKLTIGNGMYSKIIRISAFVDPCLLKTDLPRNAKQRDVLALGEMYVLDGKVMEKQATVKVTCTSTRNISFEVFGKRLVMGPNEGRTLSFSFPFPGFHSDEAKFIYPLYFKSLETFRIIKVIDIVGEMVVSNAALLTELVNIGVFGRITNWQYEQKFVQISNLSNVALCMTVSCDSKMLKIPARIDDIPNLSEYSLPLVFDLPNCEVEGEHKITITFTNRYNPGNALRCIVTCDIWHSFLQFSGDSKSGDEIGVDLLEFRRVVDSDSRTGNVWFGLTNRLADECSVEMEIEEVTPGVVIALFLRNAEAEIHSLDLQPNEAAEIRVKATIAALDKTVFEPGKRYCIARVKFVSDGTAPMFLNVNFVSS
jgi:hypothetical protein